MITTEQRFDFVVGRADASRIEEDPAYEGMEENHVLIRRGIEIELRIGGTLPTSDMGSYWRIVNVVGVDPVVKAVDPIAAVPNLPVVLQYFAAIHRKGEQKVGMQMLDDNFHWVQVL